MTPQAKIDLLIHSVARRHGLSLAWLKADGRPILGDADRYRDCLIDLNINHGLSAATIAGRIKKDRTTILHHLANQN